MKNIILIISVCIYTYSYSQSLSPEVIASAGEYFEGTNAKLSWTLGEVAVETFSGTNTILTQGFQQKFDITTIQNELESKYQISIYPNPSNDLINIIVDLGSNEQYNVQLFDMQGKILENYKFCGNTSKIDVSKYAPAQYLLRINNSKGEPIKMTKVTKNF